MSIQVQQLKRGGATYRADWVKPDGTRRTQAFDSREDAQAFLDLLTPFEIRRPPTTAERFWAKVSGGDVTECWVWTAFKNPQGYGYFTCLTGHHIAHRWAYEALIETIPPGLHLDHLCRNTSCVNPWHLDPVTIAVNTKRQRYYATHAAHVEPNLTEEE